MTNYLTHGIILSFIYFQAVILVIVLGNIILLHRIRYHNEPASYPPVSILEPVRNEEKRISKCIH